MRSAKGSIITLGKDYYKVQVSCGKDPITGKPRKKSKNVRGSRAKAEMTRAMLLASIGDTSEVRESMTLDEFFWGLFLPDAKNKIRATTFQGYITHYVNEVQSVFGVKLMCNIKPIQITFWLNSFDTVSKRFEAFKMLRILLNKAVRWDLLDSSPCDRVEPPRKKKKRPQTLSARHAIFYLNFFRGHPLEAAVLILIGVGTTRSELVALDYADVSPDGAVLIDDGVTVVRGKPHHDTTKTEFRKRVSHMPATMMRRFNEIRLDDDMPICHEKNGQRMNPDRVTRLYSKKLEELPPEIPRIALKNLRHTSLTLVIESCGDIYAASRRGGHASTKTTEDFYLEPDESLDIETASKYEEFLLKTGSNCSS